MGISAALVASVPAQAVGGPIGGTGGTFFLNDSFDGWANTVFEYGEPTDEVYVADLDQYHDDGLVIRRGNTFLVRNSLSTGPAESTFAYGNPGDTVLVGDWDGDGTDSLAVRRGNAFFIKNSVTSGVADEVIEYGNPGDTVLVGDWNDDGVDTLAVRRGSLFFLKDEISSGVADRVIVYGNPNDDVLVGDWDGDGADTLGVRRARSVGLTLAFGETWYGDGFSLTASPVTPSTTGDGHPFLRTTLTLTNTSTVTLDPRNYLIEPRVNGVSCGDTGPFDNTVRPGATVTVDDNCYTSASTGEFRLRNALFAADAYIAVPFSFVGRF